MKDPEQIDVTRQQAVRLSGISARQFAYLETSGVVVPLAKGRGQRGSTYDAFALMDAIRAHQAKASESPRDGREREQMLTLKMRREREAGTLWRRADVERAGRAVFERAKAGIRRLGSDLVRNGHVPPAGQAVIDDAIDQVLRELADIKRIELK